MTTKEKIASLKAIAEFTIALHGFPDSETYNRPNKTRVWLESFRLARTEKDILNLYNLADENGVWCRQTDDFKWYITKLFDWA